MRITGLAYLEAAIEHLPVALDLHNLRHYVMSHYVSGVTVECLFRAYQVTKEPSFDARHDLSWLYRSCGISDLIPIEGRERFEAALQVVFSRWSNNLRYFSEARLKLYLKKGPYCRVKVRGDLLKESSRMIVESSARIVNLGVTRWQHLKND